MWHHVGVSSLFVSNALKPQTRRGFLRILGASAVVPGGWLRAAEEHPFAPFDRAMEFFMKARQTPGGALAVVKDGRQVYARGYGWADRERQVPVRPETLFRIASISKPFTAVAVLRLIEQGRLDWETKPFGLLKLDPLDGKSGDARLGEITLRQLLQHTAGWDRDKSGDPMFRSRQIARAAGRPSPAPAEAIIRYMLGQPLDFAPGTHYAYSNFGYCVLGRVIERVTGRPYEEWVRQEVLAPAGIGRMRLGESRSIHADEAHYYTAANAQSDSVFEETPGRVPDPYGSFCLEVMDAHGGWLASAPDLACFAIALDQRPSPLLKPNTLALMDAPPPPPVGRSKDGAVEDSYYGCGWSVRPVKQSGRVNYWHNGSLPGTWSLLVRRWDGLSWAVVFNQRSENSRLPDGALDPALHRAADEVRNWPKAG